MKRFSIAVIAAALLFGQPRTVETVAAVSRPVSRTVPLPGEIAAYEKVSLQARVAGFVDEITVDRGSVVKKGQVLVRLSAPELAAQLAEAQARQQAAEAARLEAQAQLASNESVLARLKKAAGTAGAISPNELEQAEKTVDSSRAYVQARVGSVNAARASVLAAQEMQQFLVIKAPFDGVVTERMVHPGALVGPGNSALVEVQDVSRLRLIVAVPESYAGNIANGSRVEFKMPAYPGETFVGTVARNGHVMDAQTRTMPIELDVLNRGGRLAPGMFPQVTWPVDRGKPSLLVPATSIVTTTERTFVIRVKDGHAEWVNVKKGAVSGDLVEVIGSLVAGDRVVKQANDEIRDGSAVVPK
jgi:membrane fusion protein, multidrug efflux system